MDADQDRFLQAFRAKCREVIRPELDRAVGRLRPLGHAAEISSREFDAPSFEASAARAEAGPSLTLAVGVGPALAFYGDLARQLVGVDAAGEGSEHNLPPPGLDYALDELDAAEVAAIVAAWEASLEAPQPAASTA